MGSLGLQISKLCQVPTLSFCSQIEAEDQELATFCGRETTDTEQAPGQQVILSPGPYMGLTFRSDFSNEERFTGFDAHYTAVGKQRLSLQDEFLGQHKKFERTTSQTSLGEHSKSPCVQPVGCVRLVGCLCDLPHGTISFSVLWQKSPRVRCGGLQGDLPSLLSPS